MVNDTLSLISPVECVGCQMPDTSLCTECASSLRGGAIDVQLAISREFFGRPVRACAPYSGRSRAVVLGFKDHGHHRIAPFLAQGLVSVLDPLMVSQPEAVIVPIPSSPRGRIRRGIEPTALLAKHVNRFRPQWTILGACVRATPPQAFSLPRRKASVGVSGFCDPDSSGSPTTSGADPSFCSMTSSRLAPPSKRVPVLFVNMAPRWSPRCYSPPPRALANRPWINL